MRRLQLVELEDLPWWPQAWRDAGTAYLAKVASLAGHDALIASIVGPFLQEAGESEVLDLCSGGGGPTAALVSKLAVGDRPVRVRLTDRFPNLPAFERLAREHPDQIAYERDPVDATEVPAHLPGVRTLFNALHHFPPAVATRILQAAVTAGRPIVVVELVGRRPGMMAGMLVVPVVFALMLPFLRPFRWSWLPFAWLVPILPLWVGWDGLISCLRVYSVAELREMIATIDSPGWAWDVREVPMGAGAAATVLTGRPPRA